VEEFISFARKNKAEVLLQYLLAISYITALFFLATFWQKR
jgi:hypothetical protein